MAAVVGDHGYCCDCLSCGDVQPVEWECGRVCLFDVCDWILFVCWCLGVHGMPGGLVLFDSCKYSVVSSRNEFSSRSDYVFELSSRHI